jgi:hypothetical protein
MNFVDYNNVEICKRLYEKYQLCIQNKNLNNNIQCNIKLNKFFLNGCQYLDEYHGKQFDYLKTKNKI